MQNDQTGNETPVVFITDGNRGIGAAIAERCAEGGFDIWLNYHSNHAAAGKVNFLLSREAGYITGQVLSINGGLYI